jgi:hypothetical protein
MPSGSENEATHRSPLQRSFVPLIGQLILIILTINILKPSQKSLFVLISAVRLKDSFSRTA